MNRKNLVLQGDCLDHLQAMRKNSVNLVFCSPPYEDARKKAGNLREHEWVMWALPRFRECLRVCKGLVAWVVQGRTKNFEWSATPISLMNQLKGPLGIRKAVLRQPPIFHRVGIFGSGGKDWLRNDYDFIICATSFRGPLPWSDNTAMGHPPKYPPGGPPSHRKKDGSRVERKAYKPPKIANPGNVISGSVGRGHMGSLLAHECSAPFPEYLAEFFIKSFCRPGGIVLDPFSGSGTTAAVATKTGRRFVAIDNDPDMVKLTRKRVTEAIAKKAETEHGTE